MRILVVMTSLGTSILASSAFAADVSVKGSAGQTLEASSNYFLVNTPAGPLVLATLGANDIVGEMAILGDVPRTATVQAKTRIVALRIAKEPFMRMVREFPTMAVSIMRELAHRLELTNNQLRNALSEVRRLREGAGPQAAVRQEAGASPAE